MTNQELENHHPLKVKTPKQSKKWVSFIIANVLFLLCFYTAVFFIVPLDWKIIACLAAFYAFMYVGYAFCQSAQDVAQVLSSVNK